MEILSHLDDGGVWLAAVVGGLVALGWLLRKAWRGIRRTVRFWREEVRPMLSKAATVLDLAEYELQHNGGGSIKDAASLVPLLRSDFALHLQQAAERDRRISRMEGAVRDLAEALPIVARSTPHPDDQPSAGPAD